MKNIFKKKLRLKKAGLVQIINQAGFNWDRTDEGKFFWDQYLKKIAP